MVESVRRIWSPEHCKAACAGRSRSGRTRIRRRQSEFTFQPKKQFCLPTLMAASLSVIYGYPNALRAPGRAPALLISSPKSRIFQVSEDSSALHFVNLPMYLHRHLFADIISNCYVRSPLHKPTEPHLALSHRTLCHVVTNPSNMDHTRIVNATPSVGIRDRYVGPNNRPPKVFRLRTELDTLTCGIRE